MNNVTKKQIENGPNTLKAKWLDPECWDGCQSRVFKEKLDRVKRQNAALRQALSDVQTEARLCLERDECEIDCETVLEICGPALQSDAGRAAPMDDENHSERDYDDWSP